LGEASDGRPSADRRVESPRRLLPADRDRRGDRLAQERRLYGDDVRVGKKAIQESPDVVERLGAAELEEEDGALQTVRENTGFSGALSRYASNGIARLRRKMRPSGVARTSSGVSSTSPSRRGGSRRSSAAANSSSKRIPKRSSISLLRTTPWHIRREMTSRRRRSSGVRRAPRNVAAPRVSTSCR